MVRVCYYKGCGVVYGEKKPLSDKRTTHGLCPNHLKISLKREKGWNGKRGEEKNVMGIILIVILVIVLIGALPTWNHSKSWGPYPSGGIGLILLILIILLLLGRIWGGFKSHELVLNTNDIEKSGDFQPPWFTRSTARSPTFQGGVEGAAQGEPRASLPHSYRGSREVHLKGI